VTDVNIEHDDATITGDAPASWGPAVRLLRVVWSALRDGAAMHGAAVHGYPHDVIRLPDNE